MQARRLLFTSCSLFLLLGLFSIEGRCACPIPDVQTYADIVGMIQNENISSTADFVKCLPESYKKSPNYTLMYRSHSPEANDVSYAHPRVIAFGPNAKFVFAFTGKSDGEHSHKVQIVDFSNTTAAAYELNFKDHHTLSASMGHKNPEVCMECHKGHNGRFKPIWRKEGYPIWDGAYGSVDDIAMVISDSLLGEMKDLDHLYDISKKALITSKDSIVNIPSLFRDFVYENVGIELDSSLQNASVFSTDVVFNRAKAAGGGLIYKYKEDKKANRALNYYVLAETKQLQSFESSKAMSPVYQHLDLFAPLKNQIKTLREEAGAQFRPNLILTDLLAARTIDQYIKDFEESELGKQLRNDLVRQCEFSDSSKPPEVSTYLLKFVSKKDLNLDLYPTDKKYTLPLGLYGLNSFQDYFVLYYQNYLASRYSSDEVRHTIAQLTEEMLQNPLIQEVDAYQSYLTQKRVAVNTPLKDICKQLLIEYGSTSDISEFDIVQTLEPHQLNVEITQLSQKVRSKSDFSFKRSSKRRDDFRSSRRTPSIDQNTGSLVSTSPSPSSSSLNLAQVHPGKEVFLNKCQSCHDSNGSAKGIPLFDTDQVPYKEKIVLIREVVESGMMGKSGKKNTPAE